MRYFTFVFLNFAVSFVADVFLNDIAHTPSPFPLKSKIIDSLKPYFQHKSILAAGSYAGITVALATVILTVLTYTTIGFAVPSTISELTLMLVLAFPLGFIIDDLIYRFKIFGTSLDPYYKEAGAGVWGALAFIVSLVVSYILQNYFLPILS